jgi:hypothetical protein
MHMEIEIPNASAASPLAAMPLDHGADSRSRACRPSTVWYIRGVDVRD